MSADDSEAVGRIVEQVRLLGDGSSSGSGVVRSGDSSVADAVESALTEGIEGTIAVELEDGGVVEMDAVQYIDGLRQEVESLKQAIMAAAEAEVQAGGVGVGGGGGNSLTSPPQQDGGGSALARGGGGGGSQWSGLGDYIASLGPKQKAALTDGVEPATLEAMRRLVGFMISEASPGGPKPKGKAVKFAVERSSLASLCLWQLVVGYQLRDAEATGRAKELQGR